MKKLLIGLVIVLLLGLGGGYFFGWYFQPQQDQVAELPVVAEEPLPEQEVQLFFASRDDGLLVQETALIPACSTDNDCVRNLVTALVAGSQHNGLAVLPAQTRLLGAEIENDLVRLNFSDELVNFHPGGSLSELQSIYSLANSLSVSFPYLRQVQILIAGEVRQTLKGHARIDQPVYADYSLNSQGLAPQKQPGLSIDGLIEEAVEN